MAAKAEKKHPRWIEAKVPPGSMWLALSDGALRDAGYREGDWVVVMSLEHAQMLSKEHRRMKAVRRKEAAPDGR